MSIELEIDDLKKKLEPLSKEELVELCAMILWRLKKLSPNVEFLMNHLYMPFKVIRRDMMEINGVLTQVNFDVAELVLLVEETRQDYMSNKEIYEKKFLVLRPKDLLYYGPVLEHQEREAKEQP